MPAKRSRSSWPLPLVVKLNSRLDAIAAMVMTAKMRASGARVVRGRGARALRRRRQFDAARRARTAKPQAIESSAGTANAARQPAYLTSRPVVTAASATPRLPASPLTPIARPGRGVPRTSIGMPTGW